MKTRSLNGIIALSAIYTLLGSDICHASGRVVAPQPDLSASDVPSIVNRLESKNSATQMDALNDLLRVKPIEAATDAIPKLIAITKQHKVNKGDYAFSSAQSLAFRSLGLLPKTTESVEVLFATASPDFIPQQCDKNEDTMSCSEYEQISRSAAENIPVDEIYIERVKKSLNTKNMQVRNAIIERFRSQPTISARATEILKSILIDDSDSNVKTTAAQIITEKAKNRPEFAPALITAIKNEKDVFRKLFYVHALAETGGATVNELPLLINLLSTAIENESSRYYSAVVIGSLGAEAAPAVPALTQALVHDTSELARGYSAEALGKIGPVAKESIPSLIAMLADRKTPNYRYNAAEALGKIATTDNKEATQALIEALPDQESETQKRVLLALQKQQNKSPEVISALKALRIEENNPNAKLYLETLKMLSESDQANIPLEKPEPLEDALLKQLNDADEKVQQRAVHQIKQLPNVDAKFVPGLIKLLSAKDTLNTWYACEALSKAGTVAKDAAVPIMSLLKLQQIQGSGSASAYCMNALARVAPDNKMALSFLRDAMLDGKTFSSDAPANALALTGDAGVPYLIEGLKSENLYSIYVAAAALSHTTGNAKEAVPVLMELLNQPAKLGIFTTEGNKTSDRIIDALKHIAPDSAELEKALKIVQTLPSPADR